MTEEIKKKVANILKCKVHEVEVVDQLKKGLTNDSFVIRVRGTKYVVRIPGESSKFFIYRENECVAQKLGAEAHSDDTLVYIDPQGLKISRFRDNCKDLAGIYYEDMELMKNIARKIKGFHELGNEYEEYDYDPIKEVRRFFDFAEEHSDLRPYTKFADLVEKMDELKSYLDKDNWPKVMCHNDINAANVLLTDSSLDLIDWEFAGYNDPGYDFGRVICGDDYELDDPRIIEILTAYFDRTPTDDEVLHMLAECCMHNWYYVGWSTYKISLNESAGMWHEYFIRNTRKEIDWCLEHYRKKYSV